MRLLLFFATLDTGGTENQFARLAAGLADRGHDVRMVTLLPGGQFWDWLQARGNVKVTSLYPRKGGPRLGGKLQWAFAAARLRRLVARERIDVVYTALYAEDVIGWLATRGGFGDRLVWGIRCAGDDWSWKRKLPEILCGLVSAGVPLFVSNSDAGFVYHREVGWKMAGRELVVPNGIDTAYFAPDADARRRVRAAWGVPDGAPLVGLAARIVPRKKHDVFLRAAAQVVARHPDARFVFIGPEQDAALCAELRALAASLGLGDRVVWAGDRRDMPACYSALDVHAMVSTIEGFPNVLAEAMACGVPNVVTDAGDAAAIVADTGEVVPQNDDAALAAALDRFLSRRDALPDLGRRARERVVAEYSMTALYERTEAALVALIARRR